jgi:Cft2 family RNA processing exonuclease
MDFIALGGANEVGASCYYMKLAGERILLDCGKGFTDRITYGPDFSKLCAYSDIQTLSRIDAILISHAHYDHIAYLPVLADQCRGTPVYATNLTKEIGKYLMWDRVNIGSMRKETNFAKEDLLIDEALERIQPVGYCRSVSIGKVKAHFYEAGHIPGAAMIYFESDERNVLYTGDFMGRASCLTSGYHIPETIKPDTIILCALHAKHPHYTTYGGLGRVKSVISSCLVRGIPVYILVNQLTKGIETVHVIADKMKNHELPYADIFIDDKIWSLAERLSNVHMKVLSENCRRSPTYFNKIYPGVYIGSREHSRHFRNVVNVDFSLHANYSECVELIAKYSPSEVFVVHSPDDRYDEHNFSLALEFPNIQVIYPVKGNLYSDV